MKCFHTTSSYTGAIFLMQSLTLGLHTWCVRDHAQILKQASPNVTKMAANRTKCNEPNSASLFPPPPPPPPPLLDLVQILCGVLVGHVGRAYVKLEVRSKVFEVVIVRQLCYHRRYAKQSIMEHQRTLYPGGLP